MSYDFTIQFDDERRGTVEVSAVASFLVSDPGTKRIDGSCWVYEPKSSIHVEIGLNPAEVGDDQTISSIGVHIPYSFLAASRDPALRLCIALAEQLGGLVYDEQIGDYIDATEVEEYLADQAKHASVENVVFAGAAWFDDWADAATHQSLLFLIFAIGLAGVAAGAIALQLNVGEDEIGTYVFWIGLPIALAIFTIKIAFDVWLTNRRKTRN
jgi:hypothetical protein